MELSHNTQVTSRASHRINTTASESRNQSSQGVHNCDIVFLVIWLLFCFAGVGTAGFYAGKLAIEGIPFLAFPFTLVALFVVFIALLFTILIIKRKMSCLHDCNQYQPTRRPTTTQSNNPHPQEGASPNLRGHVSYPNTQQPRNTSYSTVYGQQRYGRSDLQASSLSCILPRVDFENHDDTLPSYDDVMKQEESV